MSVGEVSEMSERELTYWEAYYSRVPMRAQAEWLRAATLRADLRKILGADVPSLHTLMPPDPWSADGDS